MKPRKDKRDLFFIRQLNAADGSDQQPCQVSFAVIKGGEMTFDVRATGRSIRRVREQAEEAFAAARAFVRAQKRADERERERDTREKLERAAAAAAKKDGGA